MVLVGMNHKYSTDTSAEDYQVQELICEQCPRANQRTKPTHRPSPFW